MRWRSLANTALKGSIYGRRYLKYEYAKMGLESEDTGQLPSYTNHKDFGK